MYCGIRARSSSSPGNLPQGGGKQAVRMSEIFVISRAKCGPMDSMKEVRAGRGSPTLMRLTKKWDFAKNIGAASRLMRRHVERMVLCFEGEEE